MFRLRAMTLTCACRRGCAKPNFKGLRHDHRRQWGVPTSQDQKDHACGVSCGFPVRLSVWCCSVLFRLVPSSVLFWVRCGLLAHDHDDLRAELQLPSSLIVCLRELCGMVPCRPALNLCAAQFRCRRKGTLLQPCFVVCWEGSARKRHKVVCLLSFTNHVLPHKRCLPV